MTTCNIFQEDEVLCLIGDEYKCGLVTMCSEYCDSDEEEENNDGLIGRVKQGSVQVAWHPSSIEEVVKESQVMLVDRSLMPGDVVRRLIKGQDSQRGFVMNTHVYCHVVIIGRNQVICNVDSKDLATLSDMYSEPGDVTMNSWVGKIESKIENWTLKLNDGAKCIVKQDDAEVMSALWQFDDINARHLSPTSSDIFMSLPYEGQQLYGKLGHLKDAVWSKSTKQHSASAAVKHPQRDVIVTIDKIEVQSVDVHWRCRGYTHADNGSDSYKCPDSRVTGSQLKQLRKLDCFEPCSGQIGDKAYYVITKDTVIHTTPSRAHRPLLGYLRHPKYGAKNLPTRVRCDIKVPKEDKAPVCSEGDGTTPAATPALESDLSGCEGGSEGEETSSCQSGSEFSGNEQSPGIRRKKKKLRVSAGKRYALDYQLKRCKKDLIRRARAKGLMNSGRDLSIGQRVAVEVLYTYSIVDVMWQDGELEEAIPSPDLYPIQYLDELEFFPGDYVVRDNGSKYSSRSADQRASTKPVLTKTEITNGPSSKPSDTANADVGSKSDSNASHAIGKNISQSVSAIGEAADAYGVVISVDHAERTCKVRWRSAERDVNGDDSDDKLHTEDVSVYDIKDHPEFAFRPGHVVVRIGGYQESHAEATGQVYRLSTTGCVKIMWADGSVSDCYPHQLYLLGDELSDLDSVYSRSSDESDTDSDCNSSEMSWETENETTTDDSDSSSEDDKDSKVPIEKDSKVPIEKDSNVTGDHEMAVEMKTKIDAQQMTDLEILARLGPTKLMGIQNNFQKLVPEDSVARCDDILSWFKQLLDSYSDLRHMNRLVDGHSIDATLSDVISKMRREVKRYKAARMAQHVHSLYESNCKGMRVTAGANEPNDQCVQNDIGSGYPKSDDHVEENQNGNVDDKPSNAASTEQITVCPQQLGIVASQLLHDALNKLADPFLEKMDDMIKTGKLKVLKAEDDDEEMAASETQGTNLTNALPHNGVGSTNCDVASPTKFNTSAGSISLDSAVDAVSTMAIEASDDVGSLCARTRGLSLDLNKTPTTPPNAAETPGPITPQTPAEITAKLELNLDGFSTIEDTNVGHRFKSNKHQPTDTKAFYSALKKELKMLRTSLPIGIYVKGFEDRMDLYTVMIKGPCHTPYEDGLFFFDIQLPSDYPHSPPTFYYHSYCSDRLNPNLYPSGKVCVSLLGTWSGKGTEVWSAKSSLLQVLISIQGLILVNEPYFNEAGYEKQKGTQQGQENSRMYNEMALLKLVQSMMQITVRGPPVFHTEIREHLGESAFRMVERIEKWLEVSAAAPLPTRDTRVTDRPNSSPAASQASAAASSPTASSENSQPLPPLPSFPLFPCSKGFQLSMKKALLQYRSVLQACGISQ